VDNLLRFFEEKLLRKSVCAAVFAGLAMFFCTLPVHAQSLGDPIVSITFGSGPNGYGPALAADSGSTTYTYVTRSPEDGEYGIFHSTEGLNRNWLITTDHTGDPNGYMMIVNASYDPGLFYTRKVNGLCGSTTYQFGAWIRNILKGKGILPNVSFSIETPDGQSLGTFNTGDIVSTNWIQYAFTFTTPASLQTVVIKMTNNAPGGGGNDIAIDDITFRPYGTPYTAAFDQGFALSFCSANPQNITVRALTPLDTGYAQRLQRFDNGQWLNHSLPTTSPAISFLTPDTPGVYTYRVIKGDAGNIDYTKCVVSSNTIAIRVSPPPLVKFLAADTICQGDTVVIRDQTLVQGLVVTGRTWDFGDGTTSTDLNPKHLYTAPGDYIIKQTVTTDMAGCGNQGSKTIHVVPAAQPAFDYSMADCPTKTLLFTDKTVIPEGTVVKRQWDFGDGTSPAIAGDVTFQHKYDTAGVYKVTLSIKTNKGCLFTLTKNVTVHNAPQANFILPEVCISDVAQFLDSTVVDKGVTVNYSWNFGDDNAAAADNTSTLKNPSHKYTQAKQYPITLTITTSDGCQQTVTKTFTVNGANPTAVFTIPNTTVCSNQEAYFVNNSTVDFGSVTRLKWDFGDGTQPIVDENPSPGKMYRHKYAQISLPQTSRNFVVRLTAYSGSSAASCAQETEQTVTILAVPQITLSAPDSVCLNFGNVQFAVQETTGATGSGSFSGAAISSTGLFDPLKAGLGTFDIKYIYTAASGCADTIIHKIKVNPIGTVALGSDIPLPDYESITLHPTVSGDGLKYRWKPALGLSSDTTLNPVVKINQDMTYTLTVTNKYGCSVSGQIHIISLHGVTAPNTFTPNGDGINDTWLIKNLWAYKDCTVDIFNRNGQKVYTSTGYSQIGWDGRYNGADLPVGVYYYIINPKHGQKVLSGYVAIIR